MRINSPCFIATVLPLCLLACGSEKDTDAIGSTNPTASATDTNLAVSSGTSSSTTGASSANPSATTGNGTSSATSAVTMPGGMGGFMPGSGFVPGSAMMPGITPSDEIPSAPPSGAMSGGMGGMGGGMGGGMPSSSANTSPPPATNDTDAGSPNEPTSDGGSAETDAETNSDSGTNPELDAGIPADASIGQLP